MSEESSLPEGGGNVEISSEEISTEIGSGQIEAAAQEESGLQQPIDGEATDQLAEDLEQAVEDGASDEELQELIETFKFKANGQDKEVTLDWNNKEDIVRRLQMAEAAQPAMQRAAETERSFDDFLQDVQSNPSDLFEQLGIDPVKYAEEIINREVAQLQKSPEQLAQEDRDHELEELRQKLKDEEQSRKDFEFNQMQHEAELDLNDQITDALSATTELPKSAYVVKRIADAMLNAMSNGYDDVTAKDVLPWVQKEINEEMSGMFAGMEDKVLENFIGKKTTDRLRKQRLGKIKPPGSQFEDTGRKPMSEESPMDKKKKLNDWLKGRISL